MKDHWYVIANPTAGGGKTQQSWGKIFNWLSLHQIKFKSIFTQYLYHAFDLTQQALKDGYRKFIIAGGDGTYNEVINGIFKQKEINPKEVTLTLLPLGTGNDWAKTIGMSSDVEKSLPALLSNKIILHDIGKITYQENAQTKERYFLNVAGLGFDAYVANRMSKNKSPLGQMTYLKALFSGLISYRYPQVSIQTDTKLIQEKIMTIGIGICKYFGGGMKIIPNAIPNDGLFDITLIKKISKLKVASRIATLYTGTFIKLKEVEVFRTKKLHISSSEKIFIQADGELLGHTPAQFEIIPNGVQVVVPASFHIKKPIL